MHDAARVRRRERARDLCGEVDRLPHLQRSLLEPLPQRLALDELAHHERPAVDLAEIVDDENVRMIE